MVGEIIKTESGELVIRIPHELSEEFKLYEGKPVVLDTEEYALIVEM